MPVPAATRPLLELAREDGVPEHIARGWTRKGLGLIRNGQGVEVVPTDEWRTWVKNHRQAAREQALTPAADVRMSPMKLTAFEQDVAEMHAVATALGVRARFVEPLVVRLGLAALKQRIRDGESLDGIREATT